MKNSKLKKFVMILLVVAIFIMSSAYALLYRNLRINGNASVVASWKVGISGISEGTKVGNAYSGSIPTYTVSTATFDAKLQDVGDSIEYVVTISNNGGIDAKLDNVTVAPTGSNSIVYEVIGANKNDVLKAGSSINVTVKVSLDKNMTAVTEDLSGSVTIIFGYVQNV